MADRDGGEARRYVNKANADAGRPGRILVEDGNLVPSGYFDAPTVNPDLIEVLRMVTKANADAGQPGRILAEDGGLVPNDFFTRQYQPIGQPMNSPGGARSKTPDLIDLMEAAISANRTHRQY